MYPQQGYPQFNAGPGAPQVVYGAPQQPQAQQPVFVGPAPYPSAPVYYASAPQPVVYTSRPAGMEYTSSGPQPQPQPQLQPQAQVVRVGYWRSASNAMARHRRPVRIISGIIALCIIAYIIYQVVMSWGHTSE